MRSSRRPSPRPSPTVGRLGRHLLHPPARSRPTRMSRPRSEAALTSEKPCLATLLYACAASRTGCPTRGRPRTRGVRSCRPTRCPRTVRGALAAATRYAEWLSRDRGVPVMPTESTARPPRPSSPPCSAPTRRPETDPGGGHRPAGGLRHQPVGSVPVRTVDDAVAAAESMGYPSSSSRWRRCCATSRPGRHPGRPRDEAAVRAAFAGLNDRLAPLAANAFVVQKMATPGVSCVVRSDEDPLFGPVVSFSVAGPPTELLGDIGHRIPPLTDVDVSDLISSVKAAPMLHGHRGRHRCTGRLSPTSSRGCPCWPTTSRRWPPWCSTRSTPTPGRRRPRCRGHRRATAPAQGPGAPFADLGQDDPYGLHLI